MKKDIASIFNKFAGKELLNPNRITCDVDTVLAQMEQAAKDNGLELCVLFPGSATAGLVPNRVTVDVVPVGKSGRYRIKGFHIG